MEFSNTNTEEGIIQEIDDICGTDNSSYPLKRKTARVNRALDDFTSLAILYDKNWSYDDSNKYDHDPSPFAAVNDLVLRNLPIARTKLNAGQQDYPFDLRWVIIKGVFIKLPSGDLRKLEEATGDEVLNVPTTVSGVPTKFKFIGNSLLFDVVPNYSIDEGIKIPYVRNASYFQDGDTDKEPGIPNIFHEWLCWKASLPFLIKNKLPNKNDIAALIAAKENPDVPGSIPKYFAARNGTRKPRMSIKQESNK